MPPTACRLPRLWLGFALAAGVSATSCATGSGEESASPLPPSDGGFSDGTAGTGGTGGTNTGGSGGSTGGSGGTSTGGTGGTGGSVPAGQCETCSEPSDCATGFTCVTSPQGHPFCAADCENDPCPAGDYECVDLSTYGLSDPAPSGQGCVPSNDESCSCTSDLEGATRPCFKTSGTGTCVGEETCQSGAWAGCDAPDAEAEICDGEDNDCNGLVDAEETTLTGNDLCSGGIAPPHGSFACVAGSCQLGDCDDGWAVYPPNLPVTAGCACPVDPGDISPATNEQCTDATAQADLPDQGGTPVLIEGSLHSDSDVDWHAINLVDSNQVPSFNTYRVHIEFLQPDGNPGDEYRFDVVRGTAADPCTGVKTELTSYDWCADSTSNPAAPADADQSAPYRLRVYRNPAVTGTCNTYRIRITNGGSGACPAADACGST